MIITYSKSHTGVRHPYFICGRRHNKMTDCKQRAVLIADVERQVERIYDKYSFPREIRVHLENEIKQRIEAEHG